MADPTIPLKEYAARRKKLMTALKKSVALIHAGDQQSHLPMPYRPHPHFEYYTGVVDEPGAVLMLDPGNPVEARREVLFLKPIDPEIDKWDGYRLEICAQLRKETGFKTIFRSYQLGRFLLEAVKRSRSMACVHPLAQHDAPLTPDLEIFQKLTQRIPGASIEDHSEAAALMRSVKSANEIAMIQKAIDTTAIGIQAVLANLKPGMNEFDVQEIIEHGYRTNGARDLAFETIAGSGINTTVLHYCDNSETVEDGDLVLIDTGARFGSYGADITRTFPASGKFTKRQKVIYNIVLSANEAAIKASKPGVRLSDLDKVARAIITKAGYGDYFIHGIGHHIGVETHDVTPDTPLKVGSVFTIEPGIYIPDEKIGVRIEDDILITKTGYRSLSVKIPKTIAAIEKAMKC